MVILNFLIATAISLFDPILLIAYVLAGVFTRSIRGAAGCGIGAGGLIVGLISILHSAGTRAPHLWTLFGQTAACGIGAVIVRIVAGTISRGRVERPSDH